MMEIVKKFDMEKERETDLLVGGLSEKIARLTKHGDMTATAVPGLSLFRREEPTEPFSGLYEPSLCLVAQGSKRVLLGDDTYTYDPRNYLITSVHLPTIVCVTEASRERPYLGLKLVLDLREVSELMLDTHLPSPLPPQFCRGMATGRVTLPLVDAVHRLIDLLEEEKAIPILGPLIHREILYRLLTGEQGARLREFAVSGSRSRQIAHTIEWMKQHFTESISVEDLSRMAGMSPSSFHQHFRAMTALSPLQYQKQLRLQEARRLMLTERLDAATAAFRVGYESPSQFSREYGRMFGAPPRRDMTHLRQIAVSE
jgi:AraC-like DNA-binding protein